MPILLPFLLLCAACERYKTPELPEFSDDKVSYEQIIEKKEMLKNKFKKSSPKRQAKNVKDSVRHVPRFTV